MTTLEQADDAFDSESAGARPLRAASPDGGDDVSGALAELSGLLLDGETLEQTLQRVVDLAARTIPGCTGASVTLLQGEHPATAAYTDQQTLAVDRSQYDVGDGPCLESARTRSINRVNVSQAQQRWPHFTARAREHGICSFLAAPLVAGGKGLGSLNLYSSHVDGFDGLDEGLVTMYTGQAAVALANAQLYRSARRLSDQLKDALVSRGVIERAKGALMVTLGVTEGESFAVLRRRSQAANRKLRDVAADVLRDGALRT